MTKKQFNKIGDAEFDENTPDALVISNKDFSAAKEQANSVFPAMKKLDILMCELPVKFDFEELDNNGDKIEGTYDYSLRVYPTGTMEIFGQSKYNGAASVVAIIGNALF